MRKLLILVLILFSIILAGSVYAANCGGATACSCGDTLNESRTLNASDNLIGCAGDGLDIAASNITLDCDGNTITGTEGIASAGVKIMSSFDNCTIKNCIITNFSSGINLGGNSEGDYILNNIIYNNTFVGIFAPPSDNNNNTLINNTIYNNPRGIQFQFSSYNTFENNNISSNDYYGLWLESACFLANTKILLADGSYKNIEDIKIGELVKSYDEEEKELRISKVKKIFYHEETQGYLIINNLLKLTKNHPMYVNNNWIPAGEIKIGDLLLDKDGDYIEVTFIEEINEIVPTYNLEVSGYHNYFAEGILTHNKCPRVFTHNGEEYEFDLLINVAQFSEDNDEVFSYPLKHMEEPRILIEYDPDELNYIDHLELKITDGGEEYILKPISCVGSSCDLSEITERDYDYLVLDENFQEYYIEFEELPVLEEGYERTIEIISSGYQVRIRDPDYEAYPDYINDFLREYFTNRPHHSYNDIINNNFDSNGFSGTPVLTQCALAFQSDSYSNVINNTITNNKRGACLLDPFGSQTDVNITGNTITNNNLTGLYIGTPIFNTSVWHNNIYNNSLNIDSSIAIELSLNNEGNYWGRSTCPAFIAGTDSNAANVVDSYAYDSSDGWLTENPLACCGSTIHNNVTLTYNLTNCSGNGLNIATAGVTLDCNGYTIGGSGSSIGVNVSSSDNAVVHNCTINNFDDGISLDLSDNVDLTCNTITGGATGIFVYQSAITTIQNNDISGTSTNAITLSQTGSNQIISNNIHDNSHVGISMLSTAGSNNITLNNITRCQDGIQIGTTTSKIYNNNIYNNSGYSAVAYSAVNISYNQEGNYWGRNTCPLFIAGTDSDRTDAIDYYPYNTSDGWLTGSPTICDTTGPSVTITTPLSGAKIPSITNYIISGSVTDDTLVSTVTVTMMPVFTGPATYNSSDDTWSFVADMTAAIEGYYNITVNATDLYGNYNTTTAINVQVDGTPPNISSISAGSLTSSGATITWTTDEDANSTVDYGTTTALGSTSTSSSYTTSHSRELSGLSSSTTYYYNVTSCDQAGNCQTSGPNTFTTSATTNGGGGGGGGGTVSNIGDLTKEGLTFSLRLGKILKFMYDYATHTIRLTSMSADLATVLISSDSFEVTLNINESKEIDIDGNGMDDAEITLLSIESGLSKWFMKAIDEEEIPEEEVIEEEEAEEEIVEEAPPSEVEVISEEEQEEIRKSRMWIAAIIIILVVIAAIICLLVIRRKRNHKISFDF